MRQHPADGVPHQGKVGHDQRVALALVDLPAVSIDRRAHKTSSRRTRHAARVTPHASRFFHHRTEQGQKSSLRYSPRQFQATPDIFTCDNKHLSSRLVHHANLPAPAAALILRLFYTSSGLIMTAGFRNTSVGTSWYAMTARLGKE